MKRLFIGIPVKSKAIEKFAWKWGKDHLLNQNRIKWVKPENLHITLFFLGNTPESAIADLKQLIDESFTAIQPFSTQFYETGVFPDLRNPKVLWLGLENLKPLMAAYNHLGGLLRQNGFTYDEKLLKPHLSLARIKSFEHIASVQSLLSEYQHFEFGPMKINKVVLYESIPTTNGNIYRPLFVKSLIRKRKPLHSWANELSGFFRSFYRILSALG